MRTKLIQEEVMKIFTELVVLSLLILTCCAAFGQGQTDGNHSKEVVDELIAQLPKGTIKRGKDLPLFMKDAIRELARVSSEKLDVETLHAGVVVITDMDQYLDFIGITNSKQREVLKRRTYAFTISTQWPIYINGQSDLYRTALWIERRSPDNPHVYDFVAILRHEMVHARGQADEAIAIREEIKILENLYGRGLVKLERVKARWIKLAQISSAQVPRAPIEIRTSRP
jgi:hypothetical protein